MLKINEEAALAYEADALMELFDLEWVEPDFIGFGAGRRNVTDGAHHHRLLEDVRLSALSAAAQQGQSVTVAILDTGIDVSHASLFSRVVEGLDFLTNTDDPRDDQGQGTSVAGIIGGREGDDTAARGAYIDPMVRLMLLKLLDHTNKGFYSDFVRAIRYAVDQGAQVINLGIGGQHESRALRKILRYAARHEVVVISPMMSDGTGAAYYPAAYPETIAVGAVDKEHRRFSNSGRHIDVVAYGDDILTTDLTSDYHYSPWWGNSNACAIVSRMEGQLALDNYHVYTGSGWQEYRREPRILWYGRERWSTADRLRERERSGQDFSHGGDQCRDPIAQQDHVSVSSAS